MVPRTTPWCLVDEKTQMQGARPTQPLLRCGPGRLLGGRTITRPPDRQPLRPSSVATGKVLGSVTPAAPRRRLVGSSRDRPHAARRRRPAPRARQQQHAQDARGDRLAAPSRFTLHFTPTSASWLNAVEGGFAHSNGGRCVAARSACATSAASCAASSRPQQVRANRLSGPSPPMSFWIRLRAPRVRCALTRRDTRGSKDNWSF